VSAHPGPTDRTNWVILEPRITRMFWNRRRTWNGGDVVMTIETKWVPDGTELEVEIYEDDSGKGEDGEDDFVEKLEGPLVIENGRCVIEHKLSFDQEKLGGEIEGTSLEFYFRAKVDQFLLDAKSNLILVDLAGYRVGR
jgi:hypothetical protein